MTWVTFLEVLRIQITPKSLSDNVRMHMAVILRSIATKNPAFSCARALEILRLAPQNDIVGKALYPGLLLKQVPTTWVLLDMKLHDILKSSHQVICFNFDLQQGAARRLDKVFQHRVFGQVDGEDLISL